MSTTSQYYRNANANAHSHYQNLPNSNQEHLYALAAAWQPEPNNASYAGPPPAPFLHYAQGGVDSNLPAASTCHSWPAAYVRQDLQQWPQAMDEQSLVSRSAHHYDAVADGSASVLPLPSDEVLPTYQHQQRSSTRQGVPLNPPEPTFRNAERFHDLRNPSETPANTVDPPFATHAQTAHQPRRPSHLQSPTLPGLVNSSQRPLPSPANGKWNDVGHEQYAGHTSDPLVPGATTSGQTKSSVAPWSIGETSDDAGPSTLYEHGQDTAQPWNLAHAQQRDQAPYSHGTVYSMDLPTQSQGLRRQLTKKKAAKVPSSFVERQEKLKVSKRKGPLQEKQREKTHTMRKTKRICVRCRFYKSGCDEGDPCEKCEKITGHARSFREPCYREHLEDTSLVRRCNGREHQEEAEFLGYDWVHNSQLFEMEILWNLPGYGPIPHSQPLPVTYRLYSPRRGSLDVATSVWSNKEGEVKAVEQPAYAIYDTANLVPAFERYFSSLQPAIEEWIFARIRQDEIASLTYTEVLRMRNTQGSSALDLAMRLQCLSVVSQGYGSVWNNIPGIQQYDYRSLGSSDYEAYDRKTYDRPLPGAITHQMDVAAVKYLRKLEKALVKELTTLIFKPKIKPWYELFLAFYVIFWNLEYIHHGAHDYIKSKNGTIIENHVSGVVNTQIKKWEFAFPVLLYHWRCTLRGFAPFKLARENPADLGEKGHIDPEGFRYVTKIASLFDRSEPDRFQPPLTGFASVHHSMSSEWIVKLFKEAGA